MYKNICCSVKRVVPVEMNQHIFAIEGSSDSRLYVQEARP